MGVTGKQPHVAASVFDFLDVFGRFNPAAVFVRDGAGVYLWANPAYARLLGVTDPTEVVGRHMRLFDPPDLADRYQAEDRQVLGGGALVTRLPFRRPTGDQGMAFGYRFALPVPAATAVAGVFVDISEHLNEQSQRRCAETLFRRLFDGIPLAVLAVDADGTVSDANPAAAQLARDTIWHLRGLPIGGLLSGVDAATLRRSPVARSNLLVTDGGLLPVDVSVIPAQSSGPSDGASAAWFVTVRARGPRRQHGGHAAPTLSATQHRILMAVAAGDPNTRISRTLGLARQTVDHHLAQLRRLLHAPSRTALVARAYHLGLLDPLVWPPDRTSVAVGDAPGGRPGHRDPASP
jgi:PAS domain-containing protein/DNA-binding CsgD family transcriptional regulator